MNVHVFTKKHIWQNCNLAFNKPTYYFYYYEFQKIIGLPDNYWLLYSAGVVSLLLTLDGTHIYLSDVSGKLLPKPCTGGLTEYGLVQVGSIFVIVFISIFHIRGLQSHLMFPSF